MSSQTQHGSLCWGEFAIILILATLGFMAVVSAAIVSSATTMAEIMVLIGMLVGIAAASRASEGA